MKWTAIPLNKVPKVIRDSDVYASEDWELDTMFKGRVRKIRLVFANGTEHVWHRKERLGQWKLLKVWHAAKPEEKDAEAVEPKDGLHALSLLVRELTPDEKRYAAEAWSGWIKDAGAATTHADLWRAWEYYNSLMAAAGILQTLSGHRVCPNRPQPQAIFPEEAKVEVEEKDAKATKP